MDENHFSRLFITEGVTRLKTLIQFFQLFSQDLKDNPSAPPGPHSITLPPAVGGELNVSTTSRTAQGKPGTQWHLTAIIITAGFLIHHQGHHPTLAICYARCKQVFEVLQSGLQG